MAMSSLAAAGFLGMLFRTAEWQNESQADASRKGAAAPYPLPPLPFLHRIVQRGWKYKIQSTCLGCGAQKEAVLTPDIVQWEHQHSCEASSAPG